MFDLLILLLPLQFLLSLALFPLPFLLLLRFRTFPSWVLPERVSLFRCSTSFAVLPCRSEARVLSVRFPDISKLLMVPSLLRFPLPL